MPNMLPLFAQPAVDVKRPSRITEEVLARIQMRGGFINILATSHWQQHDYKTASETYGKRRTASRAPPFLKAAMAK